MPLTILIVGAGIGGLATAIALRQAGHRVTVLEKYADKREVGFAVSVPPNSSRILRSFGLDFKKARTSKFSDIAFAKVDSPNYKIVHQVPDVDAEQRYGAPSLAAHRVDLHNALRELAVGPGRGVPVEVREGITVVAYDPDAGSVTLEDGSVMTADVVVAADGVKSTAHKYIIGDERPTTLTRLSNVRFCLETERMLKDEKLRKILWKGDASMVYQGTDPDVGVLRYPCRDHTLQNFGCYSITRASTPQHAASQWATQTPHQILVDRLRGFDPSFQEIAHHAPNEDMYLWKVLDRDPLPAYHKSRMILLGDAAHPLQPTFGMGASFSIEDAGVLGVVLRAVHDAREVESRLKLWEELRWQRASVMVLLCRGERMDGYEISEATKGMLRGIWPREEEWPVLTREKVAQWAMEFDCCADAETAVERRFATEGVVVQGRL